MDHVRRFAPDSRLRTQGEASIPISICHEHAGSKQLGAYRLRE